MTKPSMTAKSGTPKNKNNRKKLSRRATIAELGRLVAKAVAKTELGPKREEKVIEELSDLLLKINKEARAVNPTLLDTEPTGTCTFDQSVKETTQDECDCLHGTWVQNASPSARARY